MSDLRELQHIKPKCDKCNGKATYEHSNISYGVHVIFGECKYLCAKCAMLERLNDD
jgi:late competence protein required for DNA uptake (superfamily II DNA/RNA helicase)